MQLFTVNEASRISGLNAQTARNWVTAGLILPARRGGTGTGKGHRFSLVQVFAMAAGVLYRKEGATPDRIAGVVAYLAESDQKRLEEDLKAGRTYPVPKAQLRSATGIEWLPGTMVDLSKEPMTPGVKALVEKLDLNALWKDVKQRATGTYGGVKHARPRPATPKAKAKQAK